MFRKILIANRGEIAVRIIRACREMGIPSVAVYSEADRDSLHTLLADEAICIGPAPSDKSYLNMEQILAAAAAMKAEAIHPGFGFLSENAKFAELCEKCNIAFIGPSAEIIHRMGNKSEARKTMTEAGVPVVPGGKEPVYTVEEARKMAEEIGYPVMIKASSGGGGKGMRISYGPEDFDGNFQNAQMESVKGFSDDTMYLEKYVERPRHIEFQILADKYGHVVHLGERDCSIQRRHQKVLEEAPSAAISPELRKKMGETAVRAAKAVGYENAGTIEFLLDKDKHFYFMEMNTRIQVEHPVTEMVTGLDLIKEQIRIAAGEPLGMTQDDIKLHFRHRLNPLRPVRIASAKQQPVVHISYSCADQRVCDAIRRFPGIAVLQALETAGRRNSFSLDFLQKRIPDGPPWHPHRAFGDDNIFLFCPDIRLFIRIRPIAFLCGDKPGGSLNA